MLRVNPTDLQDLVHKDDQARRAFVDGIRNEMPHETYLELAAWYHDLNRPAEARQALELAPPTAGVLYWLAFLKDALRDPAAADALRRAEAASRQRAALPPGVHRGRILVSHVGSPRPAWGAHSAPR